MFFGGERECLTAIRRGGCRQKLLDWHVERFEHLNECYWREVGCNKRTELITDCPQRPHRVAGREAGKPRSALRCIAEDSIYRRCRRWRACVKQLTIHVVSLRPYAERDRNIGRSV